MGTRPRLSKKRIEAALRKHRGGAYLAASELSVSHTTIYNYLNKFPDLKELQESFAESMVDKAEYKLHEAVVDGDPWAIKYALSTKGKARGYTERTEHTGADGGDLTIRMVEVVKQDEGETDDDGDSD